MGLHLDGNLVSAHSSHHDVTVLKDAGLEVLARSLRSHDGLIWLSLQNTGATDIGVTALAEALKDNHELTMLNLDENSAITDVGANAIAHALHLNPNSMLTDMDLGFKHGALAFRQRWVRSRGCSSLLTSGAVVEGNIRVIK
jgi:hypothetical protein